MSEIVTTTQLDAYLSGDSASMLDRAEALVRSYCGWHVAPLRVADPVTVPYSGDELILLPSLRVTDVSEVRLDDTVVPLEDVEWFEHGVIRVRGGSSAVKVHVTMSHGFEEAGAVEAVILAVAARAKASPSGVVRSQVGQVSETYSQTSTNQAGGVSLLDSEMAVLDRYRLPARP